MELTDVYRVFRPATAGCCYISSQQPWNFLQNTSYLRAQNKSQKILSDHNSIKLELNNKSSSRKYSNNWSLNNTLLNYQWVIEEIREEIKKILEFNENENTT
jgi:hypothetical protein